MRRLCIASLLCACALFGEGFGGIWVGRIPGRNGAMDDIAFQLTQDGATLGGKLYGDYQSTPIIEGKISGDQVTFVVIAPEQAGNQINAARLHFTGSLKGGELELTRERESATNAGNGGVVQFKGSVKVSFRLKRLF